MELDSLLDKGGIDSWKIFQRASTSFKDEIVDRRHAVFYSLLSFRAQTVDGGHVYVHAHIKMRRTLFALNHAFADDASHRAERQDFLNA